MVHTALCICHVSTCWIKGRIIKTTKNTIVSYQPYCFHMFSPSQRDQHALPGKNGAIVLMRPANPAALEKPRLRSPAMPVLEAHPPWIDDPWFIGKKTSTNGWTRVDPGWPGWTRVDPRILVASGLNVPILTALKWAEHWLYRCMMGHATRKPLKNGWTGHLTTENWWRKAKSWLIQVWYVVWLVVEWPIPERLASGAIEFW